MCFVCSLREFLLRSEFLLYEDIRTKVKGYTFRGGNFVKVVFVLSEMGFTLRREFAVRRSAENRNLQKLSLLQNMETKSPGPDIIKLFSCSSQLSMKFSLLINMKMPTTAGIFIFISRVIFMLGYI